MSNKHYGLDWAEGIGEEYAGLVLAKHYREEPFCWAEVPEGGRGEWLCRAIRGIFGSKWVISPWTEEHCRAWVEEDFSVWLGCSSSGKSNDAGGLAVLDWIVDPEETYIALGSTSVPMLRMRSFESVQRYFRIIKESPLFKVRGELVDSKCAIMLDRDDARSEKASIRGVALADGDEAMAVAKLAGAHLPYVTMILDEGAALPKAAASARVNAAQGTRRFRFLSLANPIHEGDEACKFCEPLKGWASIDVSASEWRSKYGLVLHHDGLVSPGRESVWGESAKRYPFLINDRGIDAVMGEAGGNADDKIVWTMIRGFPMPAGAGEDGVLSMSEDAVRKAMSNDWKYVKGVPDRVQLEAPYDLGVVWGCDPAFSEGGDNCALVRVAAQYAEGTGVVFKVEGVDKVRIQATSGEGVIYQISDALLRATGGEIDKLWIDDSGVQSVADVVDKEWGRGRKSNRVQFGGSALSKSGKGGISYGNRASEMWAMAVKLLREGRVYGVPREVLEQMSKRKWIMKGMKRQLESKKDYKKRNMRGSPDEADALCEALWGAWVTYEKANRLVNEMGSRGMSFSRGGRGISMPTRGYGEKKGSSYRGYGVGRRR